MKNLLQFLLKIRIIFSVTFLFSLIFVSGSALAQSTYTWEGADNGSWAVAANWNPDRTTLATNDILQFNDGTTKTVTSVPTQTIGRLLVTNNTSVALSGDGMAQTLTIGNGTGDDLSIESGSSLTINSTLENVVLASSSTADISGMLTNNSTTSKNYTDRQLNDLICFIIN